MNCTRRWSALTRCPTTRSCRRGSPESFSALAKGLFAITRICRECKYRAVGTASELATFASCAVRECQGRRHDMREPSIWPADEDEAYEAIEEAIQNLARCGL